MFRLQCICVRRGYFSFFFSFCLSSMCVFVRTHVRYRNTRINNTPQWIRNDCRLLHWVARTNNTFARGRYEPGRLRFSVNIYSGVLKLSRTREGINDWKRKTNGDQWSAVVYEFDRLNDITSSVEFLTTVNFISYGS